MKKTFITAFLILVSITGFCQINPDDIINNFFTVFQNDTDKALDDIYATNPWTTEIGDAISGLKKTVRSYSSEMGEYYGVDFITKQKCTDRFILYCYMIRYDRQPIKVIFELYKPNDKWVLYALNFSTDIDDNVEAAADFYMRNPIKD